jgi:hypothetical protein
MTATLHGVVRELARLVAGTTLAASLGGEASSSASLARPAATSQRGQRSKRRRLCA